MTFYCDSCRETRDFDLDYGMLIISDRHGIERICRLCRRPKAGVPDVFWDGKPEENLANDPVTGQPRVFGSKAEKAAYLRERGIQEAGDSHHGAPVSTVHKTEKPRTRDAVKRALWKVKQMGRDVRRQEYLRIVKEGHRYAES